MGKQIHENTNKNAEPIFVQKDMHEKMEGFHSKLPAEYEEGMEEKNHP